MKIKSSITINHAVYPIELEVTHSVYLETLSDSISSKTEFSIQKSLKKISNMVKSDLSFTYTGDVKYRKGYFPYFELTILQYAAEPFAIYGNDGKPLSDAQETIALTVDTSEITDAMFEEYREEVLYTYNKYVKDGLIGKAGLCDELLKKYLSE